MPQRHVDISSYLIVGAGPHHHRPGLLNSITSRNQAARPCVRRVTNQSCNVETLATIMTDPGNGGSTMSEPSPGDSSPKTSEKERPDADPDHMGGQTSFNCALSLRRWGCSRNTASKIIAPRRKSPSHGGGTPSLLCESNDADPGLTSAFRLSPMPPDLKGKHKAQIPDENTGRRMGLGMTRGRSSRRKFEANGAGASEAAQALQGILRSGEQG